MIKDDHLFCVLEPEGAFLYAMKKNLADITDGETTNVVVIDVGGGTLDTTVVAFRNGDIPEIKKTNYGSCVGGATIDDKFLEDLETISQFKYYAG
jgi:molecular chaperone DnaK (HSP70)